MKNGIPMVLATSEAAQITPRPAPGASSQPMDPSAPSAQDLADARTLQEDLLEVFALSRNRSDAESLEEIRHLCQLARIAIEDPQCEAYLLQIERYAERFFVADDAVDWAWHTPARYGALRALLLHLIHAFGFRLKYLELRRRARCSGTGNRSVRPSAAAARRAPSSRPG